MESAAIDDPHEHVNGTAQAPVPVPVLQALQEATATTSTTTISTSTSSSSVSGSKQSKRVLTVGDGNFSYSLAFAKRFLRNGAEKAATSGEAPVTLTATSYDSYEELVDKYPESARICAQIRECGAAQVLHRVDATNLKVSLENALKETGDAGQELQLSKPFDVVIFNHPHCGEENVRRHQSLLSHFYASALEILSDSNEDSEIHLTLAKGQPERWEAIKRAHLAGLALKQQIDDVDSHELYGLEYERKRHQNGKSFHRVLLHGEKLQQQSTLFIFARRGQGNENSRSATRPLSPTRAALAADSLATAATAAAVVIVPSRKRKAQDVALQQPLEFACTDCDKSFKTAQGLKTHVHMVHELGQGSAATVGAAPAQLLPCGFCERMFKNEDAQRQHRLAKHGEDQLIQPDWYQKQQELQEKDSRSVPGVVETTTKSVEQQQQLTCGICRFVYPSQTVFDGHWQNLKPKEVVLRNCSHCDRAFDEERALRQHQNFCKTQQQRQPEDK